MLGQIMRRASRVVSGAVVGFAFTRVASISSSIPSVCSAPDGAVPYKLLSKVQMSADSWSLRFSLPDGQRILGKDPELPTCLKILHPNGTDTSGNPKLLEKSYSPVSNPATEGYFDLLVKGYAPRPGGGVGAYLCDLEVGESIQGTLKKERKMHGKPHVVNRWEQIGLVGGGTGVAPLIQIARTVLEHPGDRTRVRFLSINRHEEDILMRAELDELARRHPDRLEVHYSLTAPPEGWGGFQGRGSPHMIKKALPPPAGGDGTTMILVCGTDGFVETWGGAVVRGPKKPDGSKGGKVQGPLLGLLAEAGFAESEVFKY